MVNVKIPIGPQHPAFKEPMRLDLTVDGELVVDADVIVSYTHRGIEKAAEARNYVKNLYLVERVCGICSHSHTTSFCQAVEEILDIEVPPRALYLRSLVGELERIQSHLLWVGVAGHELGWDTLLMYSWRDRERIMDMLELISGNRVNFAMNTIGGVRRDIKKEQLHDLKKGLDFLKERANYYIHLFTEEETFLKRTKGVGYLPTALAKRLCAVGPTARASNVNMDVRANDPYAAYAELDFDVITTDTCDVWGRTNVKIKEILQSIRICNQILDDLPTGELRVKVPVKIPEGEAVSRYEAPRGELIYYVKSNGTDKPERVKLRTPTLANWLVTVEMLKGVYIADVPIVVDAIDPCIACSARMLSGNAKITPVTSLDLPASRQSRRNEQVME